MPKIPTEGVDFKKLSAQLKESRIAEKKKTVIRDKFLKERKPATTWKGHVASWSACQQCDLCDTRRKVVLARGKLPCDVLVLGEAPGVSEDVLGRPFMGNAGKLLDEIIDCAVYEAASYIDTNKIRIAYSNLVSCIPITSEGSKSHEPPEESLKSCQPRLQEFVEIAKPKALIMVGKFSQKWSPKLIDWDFEYSTDIIHPAVLIRLDQSQAPLAIQRTTIVIRDLLLQVYGA